MSDKSTLDLQLAALGASLRGADPEARIEHDPLNRLLRVRSRLDAAEFHRLAAALGLDFAASFAGLDLRQRGSDCCGGCA